MFELATTLENYYRVDLTLVAEIGDNEVPITSASVIYAIDQIPTAIITIPVGRAGDGGKVTAGSGFFGALTPFTSLKIYATAKSYPAGRDSPQASGLPKDQFLIFDGYVHQPSMQLSTSGEGGNAELKIEGFGRIGGLSGATTLGVGITVSKSAGGADLFMSYFGKDQKNKYLTIVDQIMKDNAYLNITTEILKLFTLSMTGVNTWKQGSDIPGNDSSGTAAQRALDRLFSGGEFNLLRNTPGIAKDAFGRMVAETISNAFWNTWASMDGSGNFAPGGGGDLWEVLRLLQDLFIFRIVPTVSSDYLAPITPGLGGEPRDIFNANEYSIIAGGYKFSDPLSDRNMHAYITQFGLVASSFQSSPFNKGSSVTGQVGFAQINMSDIVGTALDGGRLFLKNAPIWLIPAGQIGKNTLDPFKGISDAMAAGGATVGDMHTNELRLFGSALGDNVAESYLHELLFSHRKLFISGRLRMDVAPGNLAKIVLPAEGFLGAAGDALYGLISEVRIIITTAGGNSLANTEIGFSHVRTQQEHEKFTVKEHPLWGEKWSGKSLIEEE